MLLFVDTQYASPYAMSVFVGLKEKGIAFDIETIDLGAGANRTPEYSSKSLTQRLPLLLDDDFALTESAAITEYLEDMYSGPSLYPLDPKAKARARQVQGWLRSDLMSIRAERSTEVVFYGQTSAPLSVEAQAAAERLFKAVDLLLVNGSEHLFGEWSIADTDLALMLNRLILNGDVVPQRLIDYAKRQWERPSVQEWVNLPRPPL